MMRVAIFNDTGDKGHYGCDLVMRRLREGLSAAGAVELWSHPVGVDWRPLQDEILARPQVDSVIVNGEGSIHHAATRPRARYLAAVAPFAKERLRAKAYLINATICDIDQAVADDLRSFDAIFVRDSGSQRVLATFGLPSVVVADLTLGSDLPTAASRAGVCVTDSVLSEAAAELDKIAAANGWLKRGMHDKRRARKEKWPWSKFSWRREKDDFASFAQFLSSHDLVVTGRYHTVTMCLATQTPFVALESNTPKISWLLDDVFGSRARVIQAGALGTLDIADNARWSDAERRHLETARAGARSGAEAMFRELCRVRSEA